MRFSTRAGPTREAEPAGAAGTTIQNVLGRWFDSTTEFPPESPHQAPRRPFAASMEFPARGPHRGRRMMHDRMLRTGRGESPFETASDARLSARQERIGDTRGCGIFFAYIV